MVKFQTLLIALNLGLTLLLPFKAFSNNLFYHHESAEVYKSTDEDRSLGTVIDLCEEASFFLTDVYKPHLDNPFDKDGFIKVYQPKSELLYFNIGSNILLEFPKTAIIYPFHYFF